MLKISSNIFSTVGIIAVVAAIIIFFGVFPQIRKIGSLAAGIESNKSTIALLEREVENYQRASSDLERVAEVRAAFENMFPVREQMVSLVRGMENSSLRSGLAMELILSDQKEESLSLPKGAPVKAVPPLVNNLSQLEEVPYSLKTAGSFLELLEFIYYLENQPFITELSKLSVTAEIEQEERTERIFNTGVGLGQIDGVFFIKQ